MKKLFPIAAIAVFSVIVYGSCTKHTQINVPHYCHCNYIGTGGDDSGMYYIEGYGAQFSEAAAAKQCEKAEVLEKKTKPTVQCALD